VDYITTTERPRYVHIFKAAQVSKLRCKVPVNAEGSQRTRRIHYAGMLSFMGFAGGRRMVRFYHCTGFDGSVADFAPVGEKGCLYNHDPARTNNAAMAQQIQTDRYVFKIVSGFPCRVNTRSCSKF